MEAVGGSALAIGSIGGVIYLTPEPPTTTTRLGAPAHPSKAPAPALSSLGALLAALVGVALLLATVLLANRGGGSGSGSHKRGGRGRRWPLLDVGAELAATQEGGDEDDDSDDPMRYHVLLPSTVVEGRR